MAKQILALDMAVGKQCSIEGCGRRLLAKGLCESHYARKKRTGSTMDNVPLKKMGCGHRKKDGRLVVYQGGQRKFDHVFVAEKVLGKSLPANAVVHHIDGNPANNSHDNLVVCQDRAYHCLLHIRTRALAAVGNANWRRCKFCKQHDKPENLGTLKDGSFFHRSCMTARNRKIEAGRKPRDRSSRNVTKKNTSR